MNACIRDIRRRIQNTVQNAVYQAPGNPPKCLWHLLCRIWSRADRRQIDSERLLPASHPTNGAAAKRTPALSEPCEPDLNLQKGGIEGSISFCRCMEICKGAGVLKSRLVDFQCWGLSVPEDPAAEDESTFL